MYKSECGQSSDRVLKRASIPVMGALAGIVLATTAAGSEPGSVGADDICPALTPTVLYASDYDGPQDSGVATIRSADALNRYWTFASDGAPMPQELADLDHGRIALAALGGTRPSGGYRLSLGPCQVVDNRLAVTITLTPPVGPATRALTSPMTIWSIDDPGRPVDITLFQVRHQRRDRTL